MTAALLAGASAQAPVVGFPPTLEERQRLNERFGEARNLAEKEAHAETFRAFIAIPGGEFAAAGVARVHPEVARAEIAKLDARNLPRLLVEAEMLLAREEKEEALAKFRAFAARIAPVDNKKGWAEGWVPYNYYPVEATKIRAEGWEQNFANWHAPALPFELGPGSHVDNWLIRRFIALEAWDDAQKEFARIQRLHQNRAETDPLALQFALDHAFFLRERKQLDKALAILIDLLPKLDLDRRTEIVGLHHWTYPRVPLGISHDEFIRLAYGMFKDAGRDTEVVDRLEKAQANLARRVLAKVRMHEGKMDEALTLELAYIAGADFSPVSTAIRQGQIYETFKRPAEAAAAFEKALALPDEAGVNLPVLPREKHMGQLARALPGVHRAPGADPTVPKGMYHEMVLQRLESIYEALGKPDKVLSIRFQRWNTSPARANRLEPVLGLAHLAKSTGQEKRFRAWAEAALTNDKFAVQARVNIHWALGDTEATIRALGELAKLSSRQIAEFDQWITRWEAHGGQDAVRKFLKVLIEADPDQSAYRLALLNLDANKADAETLIAHYEVLFAPDAEPAFRRGKGIYNATQFEDYHDLAHRLLRLYRKTGRQEKLERLGLRMARSQKPFQEPRRYSRSGHEDQAMAYLISQARDKTLKALDGILDEEIWPRARKQLDWTLDGGVQRDLDAFEPAPDAPWPNVKGARLIVSDENVQDLARNDRYVFAGQPWGVAVYDFNGKLLSRIAIGDATLCMAANEDTLWVGTPIGLRRINLDDWKVSYMRCDQEIAEVERERDSYNRDYYNGVVGLALQGDILWIGSRQNIRTLNTETLELRIFSRVELGVKNAQDWNWFLFEDDGKVWANSSGGSRRYDPEADVWEAPIHESPRDPTRLIGKFYGKLWADVYIDERLRHRPAIVDPETLRAEPVRISPKAPDDKRNYLSEFQIYGRFEGKLVFGPKYPAFVLNPESGMLDPLPKNWDRDKQLEETLLPPEHRGGWLRYRHDGTIAAEYKTWLPLPDGRLVLGARLSRSPRYIYPGEDWPFADMVWELKENSGGLHWFDKERNSERVSRRGLAGDTVFDARPWKSGIWLSTNAGVTLTDSNGRLVRNFTRDQGIPFHRSSGMAEADGKFYFACRHDDHDGALVVFDPKRSRFTTLNTTDGLLSNAVEAVSEKGDALEVRYGVEYRRYAGGKYHLFPPSSYDPVTGSFSKRVDPKVLDQSAARAVSEKRDRNPLPVLGGSIVAKRQFGDETWLLGTRGVVIYDTKNGPPALEMPELEATIGAGSRQELIAEAREIRRAGNLSLEEG